MSVNNGQDGASTIRSRLEDLLNSLAAEGWEFDSLQSVAAITLAGHHGRGRITADNVAADVCLAVFRREAQHVPRTARVRSRASSPRRSRRTSSIEDGRTPAGDTATRSNVSA